MRRGKRAQLGSAAGVLLLALTAGCRTAVESAPSARLLSNADSSIQGLGPTQASSEGARNAVAGESANRLDYLLAKYKTQPNDANLCMEIGKTQAKLGQDANGVKMFTRAAQLSPKLVPAYLGQGQLWAKLERPARSVSAYEQAAKLMPNQALIELELANSYLALRDFKAALEHANRSQKLDPNNAEIYAVLGNIYSLTGDLTATLRSAQRSVELAPTEAKYWTQAGVLAYNIRKYAEAQRYFRKALEIDPTNANAGVSLADALFQTDQNPAVRAEIQRLLARSLMLDPRQPRGLYLMGRFYLEEGKLDLAVPTLRRALRWQPRAHEVMLALGQALARRGDATEGGALVASAQKDIDRTVDFRGLEFQAGTNPNPDVHLRLAELYRRDGMYDSAVHAVERGLKLAPSDARLSALRSELLGHPPPEPQ